MGDSQTLSSTNAVRTSSGTSSAKRQSRRQSQRDNGLFSKLFQSKSNNNLTKDSNNVAQHIIDFKVGFETSAPINSLRIPPPRKSSRSRRLSPETKHRLKLLNDEDVSVTSAPANLNIPPVKESVKSCPTIIEKVREVVVPNPHPHNQYTLSQKRYKNTRRCKSMEHKLDIPAVIKSRTVESNKSMNRAEVESILSNGHCYKARTQVDIIFF